jgi:hypothetical protein
VIDGERVWQAAGQRLGLLPTAIVEVDVEATRKRDSAFRAVSP